MRLVAGSRLGHYEISSLIGAGGMGEVYKARDTRLDRTVAIKVLLEMGSADPRTRERFEREARLVASLDHPHICSLHDAGRARPRSPSGEEDPADIDFLVMQYLEGQTLADRLKKGPLPLAEALETAGQIADALDRAHRHGIVHRDLKPGNVMLTQSGARLLDFGLARLDVSAAGEVVDATTRQSLTAAGAVMGTLPYMAPEQVSGKGTDARADIWAFGCVLYEMVGGRRPFQGDSHAALIGAIMESSPPPLSQAVPGVPRAIDQIVSGALVKDREDRWQSMRDVKRALAMDGAVTSVPAADRVNSRRSLYVAASLLAVAALGLTALAIQAWRKAPPPLVRFDVNAVGLGVIPTFTDIYPYVVASPDGSRIAFDVIGDRTTDIWIKRIDSAQAEKLPDTTGARSPFWSPDGQSIAFFAGGQLKRKDLAGGAAQVLCSVATDGGIQGTWGPAGVVLFTEWANRRLMSVPENGGTPVLVRTQENPLGWPEFLPDGRHYLHTTLDLRTSTVHGFVRSLDSDEVIPVPGVASRMQFAAGHLVFWREGSLVAQPFDLRTFQLTGQPLALADEVHAFALTGFAAFSVVPNLLVYQAGPNAGRLVWTNRQGLELGTVGPAADYSGVRLSFDGSNAASTVRDPRLGTLDILIHELARDVTRRLTSDRGTENSPIWSPDGKTIVYSADRQGPPNLHARSVDGSGAEWEVAPASIGPQNTGAVTPDGGSVLYVQHNRGMGTDIMLVPLDGRAPPKPIVQTPQADTTPRVSPDGKWLAYVYLGSGRAEVFVQTFPEGRGRRQISRDGGTEPRWRRDGKEIFYIRGSQVMAVDIATAGGTLEPGVPRALFTRPSGLPDYDVAPDGQRFLLVSEDLAAERGTLSAVMNWTRLLVQPY
jgi:serine/threonine protein kinase/Tol biopolymer transport system component